ncbi:TIGR03943 family putative permease subunit [Okibacterium fritillariae]|uniref:TIGR03943 family putative permease subunit n=1 Tax=Okibacterium fritillariae TaxID=123320 RepID=UPI00405551B3
MHDNFLRRWVGPVLALIGIVAMLWLGLTGKLELYIHPRYVVFTVVMAVIGLVFTLASFVMAPQWRDKHTHDEDAAPGTLGQNPASPTLTTSAPDGSAHAASSGAPGTASRRSRRADRGARAGAARSGRARRVAKATALQLSAAAIIVAAIFAMLVLPPAPLSLSAAEQRSVNSSVGSAPVAPISDEQLASIDTSTFTVKEWTTYLNMGVSAEFLAENPVDVTGFVSADTNDPDNVFFVTRFSITCCAVDASPLGLAVYHPNWQNELTEGKWVRVRGGIVPNPSAFSTETYSVVPTDVEPADDATEPYVF